MPIRDEATNLFMGLPGDGARLELTYNHDRTEPYDIGTGYGHIAITTDDLDGTLDASPPTGSSPRSRRTASARAAPGSASSATPTTTGSS